MESQKIFLRIKIDSSLCFDGYVSNICRETLHTLNALSEVVNYTLIQANNESLSFLPV